LPPGVSPKSVKIKETTPSTGTTRDLTTQNITTPRGGFAECESGRCLLQLHKGSTVCFATPSACADWFASPTKAQDYQCTYGTHSVSLAECNIYASTFPKTQSTANYLSDPDGNPLPNPDPTKVATPVSDPGADTTTNSSGQPVSSNQDCFGNVYGTLDPVGWVLRPIQCALQWAFVPPPTKLSEVASSMDDAWSGLPPGKVAAAVQAWALPGGFNGCGGLPYDFSMGHGLHMAGTLADACTSPFNQWAPFAKVIATVGICIGCAGLILRSAGSVVGFNAAPGGGGGAT
jgi:hypothetical protein